MKRAFFFLRGSIPILIGLLLTLPGRQAAAQAADCHLLVFADTSDAELKESVQLDAAGVLNVFSDNVPSVRLKTEVRQDDQLSAGQMLSTIRSHRLQEGVDTLVVFYAGHGGFRSPRGHYLSPGGDTVYRSDIKQAMDASGARLKILITDACSLAIDAGRRRFGYAQKAPVREISPAFFSLCWQPSGSVDINSSSRDQMAVGDNRAGGYFTSSLCRYLGDQSQRSITWREVVSHVTDDVNTKFRQKHPGGVSRSVAGRTVKQSTQTVSANLDLRPGNAPQPSAALRITRIYGGTAAANVRTVSGPPILLEPDDGLAAINGERLRDVQHFQQLVREMPRNARFTLTIINHRDGASLDVTGRLDQGGGYRLGLHVQAP